MRYNNHSQMLNQKMKHMSDFLDRFLATCFQVLRGTIARLKRNLYGRKSAPKLWYNGLYQFIFELGFKPVAGHPCLLIRITVIEGRTIVFVIGIFINDLLVSGNFVAEVTAVRVRMNERFILTDQGRLEYYLGVEISKLDENT